MMEAVFINKTLSTDLPLNEAMVTFFGVYSPESVRAVFFKMFQCWVVKDCNIKAEISDEEIALFFDQLIDLVAAAYILHQANRVSETRQEGSGHE